VRFAKAHFRIKVTNTGNVALAAVKVADGRTASCDRSLGTLTVGTSRSYSCTSGLVRSNFTNVAVASGKPPKGAKVTGTGHAKVMVKSKTTATVGAKFTG